MKSRMIDFSSLRPMRQPTRKEADLYRKWVRYLSDSRLCEIEIHYRAEAHAVAGDRVPNE